MSNYLSRLKQLDDGKNSHNTPNTVLTKLTEGTCVSNVSSYMGHIEQKIIATEDQTVTPANERIEKMIVQLADDPGLIYAMQTHDDVEPGAVILTLAIRGKGACELRIPKSRYDGIELLELIEKHTTRATLQ